MVETLFAPHSAAHPARTAILLSGSGSNAEAILRYEKQAPRHFRTELLLSDTPTSRAASLARENGLDHRLFDLKKFYAERGEERVTLDTPRRREIRNQWSREVEAVLRERGIELVLLAGFVPLVNLTLPGLNVHPGNLTIEDEKGARMLAGLHFRPVETALLAGHRTLRSSVILVQPYTGGKNDIDSGPVLGVSPALPVGLTAAEREVLAKTLQLRTPEKMPDLLRQTAMEYVEKLKVAGDHVVFPRAVDDFAAGNFARAGRQLFYRGAPVLTVEYSASGKALPLVKCEP